MATEERENDWLAESLRLTCFLDVPVGDKHSAWWSEVTDGEPEQVNARPKDGFTEQIVVPDTDPASDQARCGYRSKQRQEDIVVCPEH